MIDPNNVLLRCPNGHELQAAKTDLDKDLACPVCNTTFRPQQNQIASIAPAVPISDVPVDQLGYAATGDLTYRGRAKYPTFTTWMLGFWLFICAFGTVTSAVNLISPNMVGNPSPSNAAMPANLIFGGLSCLWLICIPVAIVFQLMWIHRVHADARRYAVYDDVSAGMALGLSFIPLFNVPWTAFLMLRLANFSAMGDRKTNDTAVSAIHAAKLCLITSIVMVGTCCASYSLVFASAYPIFNEAMQNNIDPKSPEFQTKMQEAANAYPMLSFATMLIVMVGAIVYAFAVRKLESSLYDRLGALPK